MRKLAQLKACKVKNSLDMPALGEITIDGFSLTADPKRGFPSVAADIAVTTFVVPPEQGIAAGANPAGPAPAGVDAGTVPVSSSAAPVAGTTASVTP